MWLIIARYSITLINMMNINVKKYDKDAAWFLNVQRLKGQKWHSGCFLWNDPFFS